MKVLLIEAGGHAHWNAFVNIPALFILGLGRSHDWAFNTQPQRDSRSRVHFWPRGKVVGGSSALNAMLYVRGNPQDYDHWAIDHGCSGWAWEDVLPYFIKSERSVLPATEIDKELHGTKGELSVSRATNGNPLAISKTFVRAAEAIGLGARADGGVSYQDIGPQTKSGIGADYNGTSQFRTSISQTTIDNGVRCSTAKALKQFH